MQIESAVEDLLYKFQYDQLQGTRTRCKTPGFTRSNTEARALGAEGTLEYEYSQMQKGDLNGYKENLMSVSWC